MQSRKKYDDSLHVRNAGRDRAGAAVEYGHRLYIHGMGRRSRELLRGGRVRTADVTLTDLVTSAIESAVCVRQCEAALHAIVELYEKTKQHYYLQHPQGTERGNEYGYGVLCGMEEAARLAERALEKRTRIPS